MDRLPFITVLTRSAEETQGLARAIAEVIRPGDILLFIGDLGAGKTTFIQGMAAGLGVGHRPTSPTFTIMHTYEGRYPILHLDLYRCRHGDEVIDLGIEDMLEAPWVVLVEWGEKAGPVVADDYLEIVLLADDTDEDLRSLQLRPCGRWRERSGELTDVVRAWVAED